MARAAAAVAGEGLVGRDLEVTREKERERNIDKNGRENCMTVNCMNYDGRLRVCGRGFQKVEELFWKMGQGRK